MTELQLFKWIKEYDPAYRWDSRDGKEDVILWISHPALESFIKLLPYSLFDEGGIETRLQWEGLAIWASDICEPFDINMENIFEQNEE